LINKLLLNNLYPTFTLDDGRACTITLNYIRYLFTKHKHQTHKNLHHHEQKILSVAFPVLALLGLCTKQSAFHFLEATKQRQYYP
jgi:hypothetical protein